MNAGDVRCGKSNKIYINTETDDDDDDGSQTAGGREKKQKRPSTSFATTIFFSVVVLFSFFLVREIFHLYPVGFTTLPLSEFQNKETKATLL